MKSYLVTYCTPQYSKVARHLLDSAKRFGIDDTLLYRKDDIINTPFYQDHLEILQTKTGAGYWLWKLYIIQQALERLKTGDVLVYADAASFLINSINSLLTLSQKSDIILFNNDDFKNRRWVKRDAYILMSADEEGFYEAPHLNAAFHIYKKTERSVKFINEMLEYGQDIRIISDLPNQCGQEDIEGFVHHKYDQAILSVLAYRYQVEVFRDPGQWGNFLKTENLRTEGEWRHKPYAASPMTNSPYPTIFHQHRQADIHFFSSLPTRVRKKAHYLMNQLTYFQFKLKNNLRGEIKKISYQGYQVFFRKNDSLIKRIEKYPLFKDSLGIYESELTQKISQLLKPIPSPKIMDIGANIGLISINMLKNHPNSTIYAFEPGKVQYELFSKTIQHNQLNTKIKLSDKALSNEIGTVNFFANEEHHSSGDGFIDTKRSNAKTKKIQVKTLTLDHWWAQQGKPHIDLIKIDTEGSEYLILQGAQEFIQEVHPVIILEFFPDNLKHYPHHEMDIINSLHQLNYTLETINGQEIDQSNYQDYFQENEWRYDTLIAIPICKS